MGGNNEVVKQFYVDQLQRGLQLAGQRDVGCRGFCAPGWMVVGDDQRRRIVLQGTAGEFARVDPGFVEAAAKQHFCCDQPVSGIKKQCVELFGGEAAQAQLQELTYRFWRAEGVAFLQLFDQRAAGHFQHCLQLGIFGFAHAVDGGKILQWRVKQRFERTEMAKQLLRQIDGALARQADAQEDRQQFSVGQGFGAFGEELFTRAGLGGPIGNGHGGRVSG